MDEFRVVRTIDPHDIIEAKDDKAAKAVGRYKVGDVVDAAKVDSDVLQVLQDRNFVVRVVVPDRPTMVNQRPAAAPAGA